MFRCNIYNFYCIYNETIYFSNTKEGEAGDGEPEETSQPQQHQTTTIAGATVLDAQFRVVLIVAGMFVFDALDGVLFVSFGVHFQV